MKKILKVILVALIILMIAAGGLAVWQWNNIQSIIVGVSEESAEIERRRNDNQTKLVEDVSTFMEEPLREMTEEEKKQIEEGTVSVAEVYQQIFEEKESEIAVSKPNNTADNSAEKDEIISRYMAQIYKLQNEFTAKAEATIKQGDRYYESIKKHDHDATARANTITHFTPVVREIESECDGKFETVITNLKNELEAIGADTSIIETIRATYANEKQLKLSYYANKYLK